MNEGILRSPKWLRNIADFEINTGDDIKGAPSKRKQKQLDKEEKERLEEERLRKAEEKARQEEEELRKRREEEGKKGREFDNYFQMSMRYIHKNYKSCQISVPKDNFLTIEEKGLKLSNVSNFEFKITLDNTVSKPTFKVYIKADEKIYDYTVSGSFYFEFKMFFINEVFFYYKHNQSKSNQSKSKNYKDDYDEDYDEYDYDEYEKFKKNRNYTDYDPKKPQESEEVKNKRRRYNLLKDVLAGHQRKLNDCLNWEKKNPGKVHPDKITTQNEITATKSRINSMNKTYQFESVYYLKHLKHILS